MLSKPLILMEGNNFDLNEKKRKISIWMISTIVIALLLIVSIFTNGFGISGITGATSVDIEKKVGDYIKNNLVESGTNVDIKNVKEENGIYKLTIDVAGQEFDSYVSKDGTLLFPTVIDMTKTISNTQNTEIPKKNKPKIELFVMSFCPYGNEAENAMLSVYELLKDKVEWNIHYIVSISGDKVSSLHGQLEVDQDEREACVLSENGIDKWWDFVIYVNKNCGSNGNCWKDAASKAGLDATKIENCVKEKGLKLMKNDESIANSYNAGGSPTLVINGVESSAVYKYNSETYKQTICSAFTKEPSECSNTLSATSTGVSGSC